MKTFGALELYTKLLYKCWCLFGMNGLLIKHQNLYILIPHCLCVEYYISNLGLPRRYTKLLWILVIHSLKIKLICLDYFYCIYYWQVIIVPANSLQYGVFLFDCSSVVLKQCVSKVFMLWLLCFVSKMEHQNSVFKFLNNSKVFQVRNELSLLKYSVI